MRGGSLGDGVVNVRFPFGEGGGREGKDRKGGWRVVFGVFSCEGG